MEYTQKEIDFILNNYEKYGSAYCEKHIGRGQANIGNKARQLGLKRITKEKHPSMQKIDPRQFWDIKSKEVAYFLGYFWADGSLIRQQRKNCNAHKIQMEIASEDFLCVKDIFMSLGRWAISYRKRKETWKETTTITTNSVDIYQFLFDHDFKSKSFSEPTKILKKIPIDLHCSFWRGFFDGDGCLWFNEKYSKIEFSSTFDYKWIELSSLCSSLSIPSYHIYEYKHKTKGHQASKFVIYDRQNILIFIYYLLYSNIGLKRKTDKMHEFVGLYHSILPTPHP